MDAVHHSGRITRATRAVLLAADALVSAPDVDSVCREAVELARERLGLERCSLYLVEGECLRGTYGTDRLGLTSDERAMCIPKDKWPAPFRLESPVDARWGTFHGPHCEWRDGVGVQFSEGWTAWTLMAHLDSPAVGVLFNDAALSGARLDPRRQGMVAVFCSFLANIIQRKRAEIAQASSERCERKRRETLEEVLALGKSISQAEDPRSCLLRIHEGVRTALGFDCAGIWLYDAADDAYHGTFGTDRAGRLVEEWDLAITGSGAQRFKAVNQEPGGFHHTADYAREFAPGPEDPMAGVRHHVMLSLWAGELPVGVLCAHQLSPGRPITDEQLEGIRLLAGYAGVGIVQARLIEETRRLYAAESQRRRLLERVQEFGQQITILTDWEACLRRVHRTVESQLGFGRAAVLLYDAESDRFTEGIGTTREGAVRETGSMALAGAEVAALRAALNSPSGFLFTPDFQTTFSPAPGDPMGGVGEHAIVALRAGGQPIGVLRVDNLPTGRAMAVEQLEALRLFAGYASIALENARLVQALREAEQRGRAFQDLGKRLNAATSPDEAARIVLGVADDLIGWDACWLELWNPQEALNHTVIMMDVVDGRRQEVPPPFTDEAASLRARQASENPPVLLLREPANLRITELPFGDISRASASIMIVPIRSSQRTVGVLSIQSYELQAYLHEDLETLQALADYCGDALERTSLEKMRRDLEEQLLQAQKMEAVGRLAGGVAHDFNNMLAVINGYSHLLLDQPEVPLLVRGPLEEIGKAGDRAAALTQQLLAFARRQVITLQQLDLNRVVTDAGRMLGRLIGEDIELVVSCDSAPVEVEADIAQMQ